MRSLKEMKTEFAHLGDTLNKFIAISKKPMDFGVGILINPSEIHAVAKLCDHGPMSLTELADRAFVSKGAMSQLVARLEKKGLVYRETAPDNQSKQILHPTELGKKAQNGHIEFHMDHDREFFSYVASMPNGEYAVFRELCRQMNRWMDNYLK
ncbi:MAG: MarR family transcriptional regulator [Pseudodesulfovibrio sp.]|uniref:Regulatory protein MarR n=2 Tax=Desulfovibrionaceae TaxID=194924 RepID=E6VTL6_PSEA9|nr:regulatory protein MarR [Pseudodesulfovibrio aespoeensis Aspo-2]MBU4243411.1 MarR family transcriptional regulator [Pseudomonadota bacterium]MBV1765300.1 MarR family transcriptional regulator [Pseudodesulfovibrio sp.]MBU4378140.1 MarR family transcriptional regulator [Pseudomonadota bacterium]MBU4474959.1 MarR family transcriptional regulator [Pseudomonadota bacterium]